MPSLKTAVCCLACEPLRPSLTASEEDCVADGDGLANQAVQAHERSYWKGLATISPKHIWQVYKAEPEKKKRPNSLPFQRVQESIRLNWNDAAVNKDEDINLMIKKKLGVKL